MYMKKIEKSAVTNGTHHIHHNITLNIWNNLEQKFSKIS